MSKRFTETTKWKQSWHRKLKPDHKSFWDYVCAQSDNSGVWEVDYEAASFDIKAQITKEAVAAINEEKERLRFSKDERFLIIFGHIDFQCGNLLQEKLTNLQKSAIRTMFKHVKAKRFTKEEFGFTGKLPVDNGYKYKEDKEDKKDKAPPFHPPPKEFLELKDRIGRVVK
jgi:hypothetical protein